MRIRRPLYKYIPLLACAAKKGHLAQVLPAGPARKGAPMQAGRDLETYGTNRYTTKNHPSGIIPRVVFCNFLRKIEELYGSGLDRDSLGI